MLGGKFHRLTEAEREGLVVAGLAAPTLALVGDQDDRSGAAPQPAGKVLVERGDAGARVDQEQHQIGRLDGQLGLPAHARSQALVEDLFQAGGVEQPEGQVVEPGLGLAAVAGHPGLVVDQGQAPAHQAVEQSRLSDIGPADDRDGLGHGGPTRRGLAQSDQIRVAGQEV